MAVNKRWGLAAYRRKIAAYMETAPAWGEAGAGWLPDDRTRLLADIAKVSPAKNVSRLDFISEQRVKWGVVA